MVGVEQAATTIQSEPVLKQKENPKALEFAQRAFSNAQELIRFMDQKASFTLAAAIGMMAVLAGLVANVRPAFHGLPGVLFYCGIANALVFAVIFALALLEALEVYRARGETKVPKGLLFPLHIHEVAGETGEAYLEQLSAVDTNRATDEFGRQVVALSAVYHAKHLAVNHLSSKIPFLAGSWLGAILFLSISPIFGGL